MLKKLTNKKGFTLMEMLIVVAIIAILIAIAIPTFSSQLEKANEATDAANIRAAYAEATVAAMDNANGQGSATTASKMKCDDWNKIGTDAKIGETAVNKIDKEAGKAIKVTVDLNAATDADKVTFESVA